MPNAPSSTSDEPPIIDDGRADARDHLWFLESLDRVNRVIQSANDVDEMLRGALDVLLDVLDCDRAWLIQPCDPDAQVWRLPMERTRPEYPGASAVGTELPMTNEVRGALAMLSSTQSPVQYGPGTEYQVGPELTEPFSIRAGMATAVRPRVGDSYALGLHRCRSAAVWTKEEERLFVEISRRVGDGLGTMLTHAALRESERRLVEAQQLARLGHFDYSVAADRLSLSASACRVFGIGGEDITMSRPSFLESLSVRTDESERARVLRVIRDAIREGSPFETDLHITDADGSIRFVHCTTSVARGTDGAPIRFFGSVQDVTELRRTEEELRLSEARFRVLVDHASDGVFLQDGDGTIIDVNRAACESLGYAREELIGSPIAQYDPDFTSDQGKWIVDRLSRGEIATFDSKHRRRDGTEFPVELRVRPFVLGGKRFGLAIARDITERLRAERALKESHELLRAIVESTPDAIFVKDLEGRYRMINSAGARFLGKEPGEVVNRRDEELFTVETAGAVTSSDKRVLATNETQTFEETATAAGVTRTYAATKMVLRDASGEVTGIIGVSRDVTTQKRLEEELRQAQKMEAIGRLAGGVAHDFNNLLTVINGCTDLVTASLPEGDARELLGEVRRAGERAATLTSQLLAFSRKQVLQPKVVDVSELLRELMKMLERLIGEDIDLSLSTTGRESHARLDPALFEQAIMNLAVNARDAMPRGGRLVISTRPAVVDDALASRWPGAAGIRCVVVSINDSGVGMTPETLARVFEPFFTTKEIGAGTGLGLAMVYGFVKQSGGHIEVHSRLGQGTNFDIYLPVAAQIHIGNPATKTSSLPGGTETILLVEDEDAVRTLAKRLLESRGYRVVEAASPQEALVRVGQLEDVRLLLTDVVMPKMSGRALADRLIESYPELSVLFMSGYTDEAVLRHGVENAKVAFLQKPFTPATLLEKVRSVLDLRRLA